MEIKERVLHASDSLSFKDEADIKKGLRGHVRVLRENTKTGEVSLWDEDDNIIPLSGYQFILMKMFGLHLDSVHGTSFEDIGRDTSLVVPDLNNAGTMKIGVDPLSYSVMSEDISANHFVQGFMIGNGGAGEDSITTKNTNYSFMNLRNPIPFQQTQTSLNTDIVGNYLGNLRTGASSFTKSYYVKKFDKRPHIYHSWFTKNQRWDDVDPVTQNDLGPNPINGAGKTDRIATYADIVMSVDETDCLSYFQHDGNNQTAIVNELGLVAFDSIAGIRSIVNNAYNDLIKKLLDTVFDNNRNVDNQEVIDLAGKISEILTPIKSYGQSNINAFIDTMDLLAGYAPTNINYQTIQTQLALAANIGVSALYNQNGVYVTETDTFVTNMTDDVFASLTTDEAQRIKLVTYYTFNSVPIEPNWRIIILYRIYAN